MELSVVMAVVCRVFRGDFHRVGFVNLRRGEFNFGRGIVVFCRGILC